MNERRFKTIDGETLMTTPLQDKSEFTGTPTEVAELLRAGSDDPVSAKALSKRLVQNQDDLAAAGISFEGRRSNGKRLITLRRASDDSDVETGSGPAPPAIDPVDPAAATG